MKINELKIGDRIKFKIPYYTEITEGTGIIISLDDTYVTIDYMGHKFYKIYIVSKLENLYKEIPIEKEEEKKEIFYYFCPKCEMYVTKKQLNDNFHCCGECVKDKKCSQCWIPENISFGGLVDGKCYSCKNKKKSFKFEISHANKAEFYECVDGNKAFPEAFFRIDGAHIKYDKGNYEMQKMDGETFIVEIREK